MSLAIVGSRELESEEHYRFLQANVREFIKDRDVHTIISGGAREIDTLAARFARENGFDLIVHEAKWGLYGRIAGPKKNQLIVDNCDFMISFPSKLRDSIGTHDFIRRALEKFGAGVVVDTELVRVCPV